MILTLIKIQSPKLNADAAEFIPRVSGLTLDGAGDFGERPTQKRGKGIYM